ncbi:MAG: cytidylate kinase-like family protein [Odoribacteraceae bacterium]|jgi:cytidylate kinase|nr:cytidylate kinase-like family protein [Odoribacteraceae bacterium]
MKKQVIITIGRQFGSRGKEIGQRLAERLGIECYDRRLIVLASRESGLCPEFFERADEKNTGSLLNAFATGCAFGGFYSPDFLSNEKLFQIQSDAIRKLAERESCVLVGRCADYILRDKERCVNIFIHAPVEIRVRTVMERQALARAEAMELVRKMDKTRANYYNYYTDKEWGVASSYHLALDSSLLGVAQTVEFIALFLAGHEKREEKDPK